MLINDRQVSKEYLPPSNSPLIPLGIHTDTLGFLPVYAQMLVYDPTDKVIEPTAAGMTRGPKAQQHQGGGSHVHLITKLYGSTWDGKRYCI